MLSIRNGFFCYAEVVFCDWLNAKSTHFLRLLYYVPTFSH